MKSVRKIILSGFLFIGLIGALLSAESFLLIKPDKSQAAPGDCCPLGEYSDCEITINSCNLNTGLTGQALTINVPNSSDVSLTLSNNTTVFSGATVNFENAAGGGNKVIIDGSVGGGDLAEDAKSISFNGGSVNYPEGGMEVRLTVDPASTGNGGNFSIRGGSTTYSPDSSLLIYTYAGNANNIPTPGVPVGGNVDLEFTGNAVLDSTSIIQTGTNLGNFTNGGNVTVKGTNSTDIAGSANFISTSSTYKAGNIDYKGSRGLYAGLRANSCVNNAPACADVDGGLIERTGDGNFFIPSCVNHLSGGALEARNGGTVRFMGSGLVDLPSDVDTTSYDGSRKGNLELSGPITISNCTCLNSPPGGACNTALKALNNSVSFTGVDCDPSPASPPWLINNCGNNDSTPPVRSNGQPTGVLPASTTSTTISLDTDETANCRFSTVAGMSYDSMTSVFSATNSTSHSQLINGLSDGNTYNYYVRCKDTSNNKNTDDYAITFSVGGSAQPNVFGFAWSENIGWVSFNSKECDSDMDGVFEGVPVGCPAAGPVTPYGVKLDMVTNNLSGYAWSENIGWVSFNEVVGCPSGTCQPRYNPATTQFSGWARAITASGGWDGWISLNCNNGTCSASNNHKVTLISGIDFEGWAWGSNVVGWLCFNSISPGCDIAPAGPAYKVHLASSNPILTVLPIGIPNYCTDPLQAIVFPWNFYDTEDGGVQTSYQLKITRTDDGAVYDTGKRISSITSMAGGVINGELPGFIGFNHSYTWEVTVWDSHNNSDGPKPGVGFSTPAHMYPTTDFFCSPSAVSCPASHPVFEVINFTDDSTCYDSSNNPIACLTSDWDFGDTATSTGPAVSHSYDTKNNFSLSHTVGDGTYTCSKGMTMKIGSAKPTWIEVIPVY